MVLLVLVPEDSWPPWRSMEQHGGALALARPCAFPDACWKLCPCLLPARCAVVAPGCDSATITADVLDASTRMPVNTSTGTFAQSDCVGQWVYSPAGKTSSTSDSHRQICRNPAAERCGTAFGGSRLGCRHCALTRCSRGQRRAPAYA